ncbi:hypothetical protein G5I_14284 [Acromyrmex echinatior]|uniref:Uncharacterized protein n=1 Tax=Acromyrmex echinatior TaxID=103372 RepID=F4X6Z4_ACREC|nr:hypothetical protein G5I_14284 [Acromyrmex echinatior]
MEKELSPLTREILEWSNVGIQMNTGIDDYLQPLVAQLGSPNLALVLMVLELIRSVLQVMGRYASLRRPSLVLKPNEIEARLDSNVHTVRSYQSSRGAMRFLRRTAGPRRNIELALWIRYQEKETEVPVEPAALMTNGYNRVTSLDTEKRIIIYKRNKLRNRENGEMDIVANQQRLIGVAR